MIDIDVSLVRHLTCLLVTIWPAYSHTCIYDLLYITGSCSSHGLRQSLPRLFPSKLTSYCVGLPQPRHLLLGFLAAFQGFLAILYRSY